jgi:hypothetical protein
MQKRPNSSNNHQTVYDRLYRMELEKNKLAAAK